MKLSELINQLQRFHDLYPQLDPNIVITEVAYKAYDKEKSEPEFYCRTLQITCYEVRTLVHLPTERLLSTRTSRDQMGAGFGTQKRKEKRARSVLGARVLVPMT